MRRSQDQRVQTFSARGRLGCPHRNTPRTNAEDTPPILINDDFPQAPTQNISPSLSSMLFPHVHPLHRKLPAVANDYRQARTARLESVSQPCEANTVRFVEIVDLSAVRIHLTCQNDLRKDHASGCWRDEIVSVPWARGTVEICVKYTWTSRVSPEEDQSVGNGNEVWRDAGLGMNVRSKYRISVAEWNECRRTSNDRPTCWSKSAKPINHWEQNVCLRCHDWQRKSFRQ